MSGISVIKSIGSGNAHAKDMSNVSVFSFTKPLTRKKTFYTLTKPQYSAYSVGEIALRLLAMVGCT